MADPIPAPAPAPTPALPSTADETPYVPVSWMAVGAALFAGLFVLIILLAGYSAFRERKPLILPELLLLPVLGIVFSFTARKMIRNSEGTRTGVLQSVDLVKAAWWTALIGGLAYSAYLLGVDFSIRRDAAGEVDKWMGYVLKDDVNRAFLRTLEAGQRSGLNPDNTSDLIARFRSEYLSFAQLDVVRLARRNPGACTFSTTRVKDWVYKPGAIECVVSGTFKCPEGAFPVDIALRGAEAGVKSEGGAGRQWSVSPSPTGYVVRDQITFTPYGWRVIDLERSAVGTARAFIERSTLGHGMRALLYQTMMKPDADPELWDRVSLVARARVWVGLDPLAVLPLTPDYAAYTQSELYRLPGGGEPSTTQKGQFLRAWAENGVLATGRRLTNNEKIESHAEVSVTDAAVEVRVPCEVPLPGAVAGGLSAARGRVLVVCTEPDILADLKRLRADANPDATTGTPPPDFGKRAFKWRVVRVESDMYEVQINPQGPGAPGGPGGRGPGG